MAEYFGKLEEKLNKMASKDGATRAQMVEDRAAFKEAKREAKKPLEEEYLGPEEVIDLSDEAEDRRDSQGLQILDGNGMANWHDIFYQSVLPAKQVNNLIERMAEEGKIENSLECFKEAFINYEPESVIRSLLEQTSYGSKGNKAPITKRFYKEGNAFGEKSLSLPALYLETTRRAADTKILKLFDEYGLPFDHENLKELAEESKCPPSVVKTVAALVNKKTLSKKKTLAEVARKTAQNSI